MSSERSISCDSARPSMSPLRSFRSSIKSSSLRRIPRGKSPMVGPVPGGSSSMRRRMPIKKPLLLEMRDMFASQNLAMTASAKLSFRSFSASMHRSSKSRSTIEPDSKRGSSLRMMFDGSPRSGTRCAGRRGDLERERRGDRDRSLRDGEPERERERRRTGERERRAGDREREAERFLGERLELLLRRGLRLALLFLLRLRDLLLSLRPLLSTSLSAFFVSSTSSFAASSASSSSLEAASTFSSSSSITGFSSVAGSSLFSEPIFVYVH
mmetsp:Transcript_44992/g.75064  ORF Transcript_44992/g.75064 Transcript_44992/m.75064 type:complete len:269 (-) Transcript_44992:97-903(-)